MANKISRRDFLRKSGIGLAAMTVVPNVVLGKSHGHTAPSDKLNIAGVGVAAAEQGCLKVSRAKISLHCVIPIGSMQKIPSIAIRELAVSGIIAQCSIRWATRSML
jgi:hypothetical protein